MKLSGYVTTHLRDEGQLLVHRGLREADGARVLIVAPFSREHVARNAPRLESSFALRERLDDAWSTRPLDLLHQDGIPHLILHDPGGVSLESLVGRPLDLGLFLRVAAGIAVALGHFHARGLTHRDIKPGTLLVDPASGRAWLAGFGLASRVPRQRQGHDAPEVIAGTLAYMAPEQTGRMNRSVDSRADLYALGVTLYQLLTGELPFHASEPTGWVHCHIAKVPTPPRERTPGVPAVVSDIVMKLLAKAAEDRYQTAAGVEHDLRACLADWEARGSIAPFALARQDVSDRLLIPERLYGREPEVERLLRAFARVVASSPELVLVSGYSGVGKSAVVNELHRAIVPTRGLFAAGKFDQYKRDIPYATLAEALGGLVRMLLGRSEAELAPWRQAMADAVGLNGQLVVALIPELELILGPQPPVLELAPQDAHTRFQMVFTRFLGVFARQGHPLVLFLDDLQWVDSATLALLSDLVTRQELGHLMIVGAFRDNEVSASHPLALAIESIRSAGAPVESIVLAPLGLLELTQLVTDTLQCPGERARPLARLVHDKTGGNPFFTVQFLLALGDEGLLTFDPALRAWAWDEDRLRAKRHTDNVVALMVERLSRLPADTLQALQRFACLGNVASTDVLALAHESTEEALHAALWEAVRTGVIVHTRSTYAFLHDRVQEAAYSLMPGPERAPAHLRIGRLLLQQLPDEPGAEPIFAVLNHLNRTTELITDPAERAHVRRLNQQAGQRALAAVAYESARAYMAQAAALLPEDAWEQHHDETFALFLSLSECEFLARNFEAADRLFDRLLERARTDIDRAKVYVLRLKLYPVSGRYDAGVGVAIEALRLFDVIIPETDAEIDAATAAEFARVPDLLAGRPIASLVDAPIAQDPRARAIINLLVDAAPPTYASRPRLLPLIVLRAMNLSLRHGNTDRSAFVYSWYALLLVSLHDDIESADQFSTMALQLNDRFDNRRLRGPLLFFRGSYIHFRKHPFRESVKLMEQAFVGCIDVGEVFYSSFIGLLHVWQSFESGAPLEQVLQLSDTYAAFFSRGRNRTVQDAILSEQHLILMLMGRANKAGDLSSEGGAGGALHSETLHTSTGGGQSFQHVLRQMLAYHAGRYAESLQAADAAAATVTDMMGLPPEATHYFYRALAQLALHGEASPDEQAARAAFLAKTLEQHAHWAEHCPANYGHRHAILLAEVARTEGRALDAMRHYEAAIRGARDHGATQFEALANELAGAFHASDGLETVAAAYLREARSCYARWGAAGKVRLLDRAYPRLLRGSSAQEITFGAPVEHLDLATVLGVSQAVSGENQLARLIETLTRLAVEHAGAQRARLVLCASDGLRLEAEASTGPDGLAVRQEPRSPSAELLPMTLLHYVLRTRETVVLDDASAAGEFALDDYVRRERSRSLLCLPLLNQNRLVGALYLENPLASHVFTAARIAVLKLLASQAAISIENARLYAELRQTHSYMAQAESLSQTGTLSWNTATGAVFWSEEVFRIYEHDRASPPSMEVAWGRTHPEDAAATRRHVEAALRDGADLRLEFRLLMPGGATKHVSLLASLTADHAGRRVEYVGALQDVTARKLAAEALATTQHALAHVTRVATLGEVAASITHEVSQPLAAISVNASACVRWLAATEPDLPEARAAAQRASREAQRTSSIVAHLRSLFQRSGADRRPLDLNEAIDEVLILLRAQLRQHACEVRAELHPSLPAALGDRVQLQQVMMNLILNAAEAMSVVTDRPRELVIRTEPLDGAVRVSVRDAGPGVADHDLEQVFRPFHTTKSGGMGMGLSISRTIVENHQGELRATRNPGFGSTFAFTVPTVASLSPGAPHAQKSPSFT